MRRCRSRRSSGFTLIETLIVVLYISILALIAVPRLTGAGRQASETNLRATLREMRAAVACYQAETGVYPASLDDLVSDTAPSVGLNEQGVEIPIFAQDFHGPYLVASGGRLPLDRMTGKREWAYKTSPPGVGKVNSKGTGTGSDGTPYSQY
jgi:general secretion pathway protein G